MTEATNNDQGTNVEPNLGQSAADAAAAAAAAKANGDGDANKTDPNANGGDKKADGNTDPKADGKPDNVPDQYWDKEKKSVNTEALLKAERDLRTKLSAGVKEPAPAKAEEYTFTADEGVTLDANDPALALSKQMAHKAGMSQGQFNTFVNQFMKEAPKLVADMQKAKQQTPEQIKDAEAAANKAEMAKLHKDPQEASKIVNHVVQFFKAKVDQGSLEEGDYKALMRMGGDAEGIKALQKIISVIYNEPPIPTDGGDTDGYSVEQYYRDVADPRYQTEPDFRKNAQAKLAKITGNQPGGQAPKGFGMPTNSPVKLPGVDSKK